ncbi:uncharacterized protein METZ01_LOCUS314958, partial [marine metagenome]
RIIYDTVESNLAQDLDANLDCLSTHTFNKYRIVGID